MIPRRFFWAFDCLGIGVAFGLAYALMPSLDPLFGVGGTLRYRWLEFLGIPEVLSGTMPPVQELLWIYLALAPATILALAALGNHGPLLEQTRRRILFGSMTAPFFGLGVVSVVIVGLKSAQWSRLFLFSFALSSSFVLCGYRLFARSYFHARRRRGHYARNVLLVSDAKALPSVVARWADAPSATDYRLCGYLSPRDDAKSVATSLGTYGGLWAPPKTREVNGAVVVPVRVAERESSGRNAPLERLGSVSDLGDLLIKRPIHTVVAILSFRQGGWIDGVIETCDELGIPLGIVPEALLVRENKALRPWRLPEGIPLPGIVLTPAYSDPDALFVKRCVDAIGAGLLLLALSPLLALIALAIRLSDPKAPVLYLWRVIGESGMPFTSYKFRTMVPNADALKGQLLKHNEMKGPVFKMTNDPRVTKLGHFLRKYSLDELPQLWSVLKGDMSLVGPRPAGPHELARYEFWHKRKLSFKPGITCLWQVGGRNDINDFDEWVRMDLQYIDNWSLWLDFKILVRTMWVVLAGTGK